MVHQTTVTLTLTLPCGGIEALSVFVMVIAVQRLAPTCDFWIHHCVCPGVEYCPKIVPQLLDLYRDTFEIMNIFETVKEEKPRTSELLWGISFVLLPLSALPYPLNDMRAKSLDSLLSRGLNTTFKTDE